MGILNWLGWAYGVLVMCLVGLIASILFLVQYPRTVGWTWYRQEDGRPNPFGRFLIFWSASRASVLLLTITNALLPPWPGQLPFSFLVMSVFALHTFIPYRLLLRAQREARETGGQDEHERSGDHGRPQSGRITFTGH